MTTAQEACSFRWKLAHRENKQLAGLERGQ
jgi:hypothetical protein